MRAVYDLVLSIALLCWASSAAAMQSQRRHRLGINPIRKVVTMLQKMQSQVAEEGEKEEKLFEKFMCYCKTGNEELTKSIKDAEMKIDRLTSSIEESTAEQAQLEQDLKKAKIDQAAAKESMDKATAMRQKEAKEYAQQKADTEANIEAMKKAIGALEKGTGGFLQTRVAARLKTMIVSADLEDDSRELVSAFLSHTMGADEGDSEGHWNEGYETQSNQIIGILKQLLEQTTKDLADAGKAEAEAIADYNHLMSAKTKEHDSLTKSIKEKTARLGEVGVELVNMKEDLEGTSKSLVEDRKFLENLTRDCETKKDEWDVRSKTRAEELVAIGDTIKILNDDDALGLFKKSLVTPSFLQLQVTSAEMAKAAYQALQGTSAAARQRRADRDYRVDLILMTLRGRQVNFDKVIPMIDNMVTLLKKEQTSDDDKKSYCNKEFDKSEDESKELERTITNLGSALENNEEQIAALSEEIDTLSDGIADLDKKVNEATKVREEEKADFKEELAANTAAVEVLGIAKARLNKFYAPKKALFAQKTQRVQKAPPRPRPTEPPQQQEKPTSVETSSGVLDNEAVPKNRDFSVWEKAGEAADDDAPNFMQVGSRMKAKDTSDNSQFLQASAAPPPPPETFGDYKRKGEDNVGVIVLIDTIIKDLRKEITEMQADEKESEGDFQIFLKDSAEKRRLDSKLLAEQEGVRAEANERLLKDKKEQKTRQQEKNAVDKYIMQLHEQCDWLLKYYEVRREARNGEIDSLQKAKAILTGADFSFLQTAQRIYKALRRA